MFLGHVRNLELQNNPYKRVIPITVPPYNGKPLDEIPYPIHKPLGVMPKIITPI